MCGRTKLLDEPDGFIVLRCDDHDYDPDYHRDSIYNVFWPIEEAGVFAPIPILPPILHEKVAA